MKMNVAEIQTGLSQFYGTEKYHRLSAMYRNLVATDGVAWLCEKAESYWLFDLIASCMKHPKVVRNKACQGMQFWKLTVNGSRGELTCEDGNDNLVYSYPIAYTDFPLPEIKIWVAPDVGELWVAMLPSEY